MSEDKILNDIALSESEDEEKLTEKESTEQENEACDDEQDYNEQKPKAPPKKKAARLLIIIVALFVILLPLSIWANSCYEKKVQDVLFQDAVVFSKQMLESRYEYQKQFVFDKEPAAVYYYNSDARFYETKQISYITVRAYDQNGIAYLCDVQFVNGEVNINYFNNYLETDK